MDCRLQNPSHVRSQDSSDTLNKCIELLQLTLVNCFEVISQHTLEDNAGKWRQVPALIALYWAVCTVPCTSCRTQRGQHMKTEPYQNPQKGDLQVYLTAAWHLVRIFLLNPPDFYKVNNNEHGSNKHIAITKLSAIC
jgi:hypothetical protein